MVRIAVVGILAFMLLFTIDRWSLLTRQASIMGASIHGLNDLWRFIQLLGTRLLFEPISISLLAMIGVAATWRTQLRWWILAVAAGIAVPATFAAINGSAGYTRNFGYLVGPVAILCGVGADVVWRYSSDRYRQVPVMITGLAIFLGVAGWACLGAAGRANAILLPDWGEVVMELDREPTTVGPRWFCRDLANHWQIGWYEARRNHQAFLQVPPGDTIEVVMGAQYDERGRATIFRHNATANTLPQVPLPAYLATTPPARIQDGVELRRWIARKWQDRPTHLRPEAPVFVLFREEMPITKETLRKFLIDVNAQDGGLVTFKPVRGRNGLIHSMIAPFTLISDLESSMGDMLHVERDEVHWFELQRWSYHTAEG